MNVEEISDTRLDLLPRSAPESPSCRQRRVLKVSLRLEKCGCPFADHIAGQRVTVFAVVETDQGIVIRDHIPIPYCFHGRWVVVESVLDG